MEEVMLPLMYHLPDMENDGVQYVIDDKDVETPRTLADLRVKVKESA
jgi:hypothetical protein